ncbi:MAG TPA: YdeI/OmpD-associated family protein [Solirubrobacteraceae bacterium]|nr:YdeI/OmpD-associated family protein [Solirubrobacteraceae bacterium]
MATAPEGPILEFRDAAAWSRWLSDHHAQATSVWIKIAKKGSPKPTVTQAEAIDEAICFGWIDGQVARHDEHFFRQRFTPRRPRSRWSAVNRERAQRLIAEGRMKPAGLAQLRAAEADGRLDAAYAPQSRATVPEDFQAALREHPEAREFFETLSGTERYKFLYRLHHTSDPGRRAGRIADYIDLLSKRRTLTTRRPPTRR